MNDILIYKKLNNLYSPYKQFLYKIMLENFSITNFLDTTYKNLLNNKSITIEILNKEDFNTLKFDLIKILYFNNIVYIIKTFDNKIKLTLDLINQDEYLVKNNLIYEKFNLNNLIDILNLNIKNLDEYLLHINKNLSNIKY
jgi:hypothetical protein|tara:strand:- start:132 stop:554 length:423 start_codon:yes stop_codon:yes gene_type:complete